VSSFDFTFAKVVGEFGSWTERWNYNLQIT